MCVQDLLRPEKAADLIAKPSLVENVNIEGFAADGVVYCRRGEHHKADSAQVEPGAIREMRFTATEPGTYWYVPALALLLAFFILLFAFGLYRSRQ